MSAECGQTCLLALLTLLLLRLLLFDKYNYRAVEVEDHSTLKFGGKFVDILCLFGWFALWFQIFGFILSMYTNFDVSN